MLLLQHTVWNAWQDGHFEELHWQLPLTHARLFVQAFPQEPQFWLSLCSLTQAPLHELYPLLQAKLHAPLAQTGVADATLVVHATGFAHEPVDEQLSMLVPEHVVCPGAQTPEQTPLAQVELTHAVAALQVPLAPHVSTPLPEHCD
jgi:hypothetical protein